MRFFSRYRLYHWVVIVQKRLGLAEHVRPLVSSRPIGCVWDEGG